VSLLTHSLPLVFEFLHFGATLLPWPHFRTARNHCHLPTLQFPHLDKATLLVGLAGLGLFNGLAYIYFPCLELSLYIITYDDLPYDRPPCCIY